MLKCNTVEFCIKVFYLFIVFILFFFQESDFAKSKLSLAWRKTHLTVKKKWLKQQDLDSVFRWSGTKLKMIFFFQQKKSRQQQLVMISFQKLPSIKQTERNESTYFLTDSLATSFFGWDLYLKCQNISIIGSRSW